MYRLITIVGVLILSMLEVVAPDTLASISINRHLGSGSQSTTINSPGTPACGDGYLETKVQLNGDQTDVVDSASCKYLNFRGTYWYNGFHFREAYDTLRLYVEHCAADMDVHDAFQTITSSCADLAAKGDTVWTECRDWLLAVRYLSSDTIYYCTDLLAYAGTFWQKDELGNLPDYRKCLAIEKYMVDSAGCARFAYQMSYSWRQYHNVWRDTVTDSLKTPFDSTLPSLDQIGQTFLRGFHAGVAAGSENGEKALRSLRAVRNPFGGDLDLKYVTALPSVTKIEVYDALGRQLWTDGQGYVDPGEHHLKIPTASWSAGTYYARLSTIRGEVLTTKLVFEK